MNAQTAPFVSCRLDTQLVTGHQSKGIIIIAGIKVGVKKGQYRREEVLNSGKTKPPSKHIQPLPVTVHYKLMPLKLGELGGWTG